MKDFYLIVILVLATWRLTSFLHAERGPFDIFVRIRTRFGIVHDDEHFPVGYPDTFIGNLMACYWCLSVWVAIGVWIAYLLFPIGTLILCTPFAISGGAIMLSERIE